jgi:hypothetical protein
VERGRLFDDLLGEELVAGKKIRQGLLWIARFLRDLPGESSLIEGGTTEIRSS